MQEEVRILFPRMKNRLTSGENAFIINNMKCRTVSVVYMILHCYHLDGHEILTGDKPFHIGERWVIDETWSKYYSIINVDTILNNLKEIQIELVCINVDDNNPLYFTECMLQDNGLIGDYHAPDEAIIDAEIGFLNTNYANLYTNNQEGDYIQVIRPNTDSFKNSKLTKSNDTIIAPHLKDEPSTDKPQNIFVEFLNQTEQKTTIKSI